MLTPCFDRLEETVDQITSALLARDLGRIEGLDKRKSENIEVLFVEMNRLSAAGKAMAEAEQARFQVILGKMEVNLALVCEHMAETAQVADEVASAKTWADVEHFTKEAPELLAA
ncbi:MAG: hypothetical protein DI537_17455 [Stutzerimonas stutzeri]|nr:MAG: hypothetical protein DI537_17455 [Stutzerimonas stutzeri]